MKINYYGQNTLSINFDKTNLLVDPFVSANPLAKNRIDISKFQPDYILLTHAHQDHLLDTEHIAKNSEAVIVSNYEIAMYYQAKGFTTHPMNHGGSWKFDFGKVKYVNAVHSSSFPDGSYGGHPGGFVISASEKNIYIAGDTALTMDMKLIPLSVNLDLAILPIGDNFTMGVEDAILASDFVACDTILGVHYDTFDYIKIDKKEAISKFESKGKKLHLLDIGESINV